MLLIPLARVHLIAELLQQHLFAGGDVGKPGLEILHHPDHIIHKSCVMKSAGVHLKPVKLRQCKVLLHLPELVAEAGSVFRVVIEDNAFPGGYDVVPSESRRPQTRVLLRIGIIDSLKNIQQVVLLVFILDTLFYEGTITLVGAVQIR